MTPLGILTVVSALGFVVIIGLSIHQGFIAPEEPEVETDGEPGGVSEP